MVDCIILICKQYIYSTKCLAKELNFQHMIVRIYETERIKARIARKNNNNIIANGLY